MKFVKIGNRVINLHLVSRAVLEGKGHCMLEFMDRNSMFFRGKEGEVLCAYLEMLSLDLMEESDEPIR